MAKSFLKHHTSSCLAGCQWSTRGCLPPRPLFINQPLTPSLGGKGSMLVAFVLQSSAFTSSKRNALRSARDDRSDEWGSAGWGRGSMWRQEQDRNTTSMTRPGSSVKVGVHCTTPLLCQSNQLSLSEATLLNHRYCVLHSDANARLFFLKVRRVIKKKC